MTATYTPEVAKARDTIRMEIYHGHSMAYLDTAMRLLLADHARLA